LHLVNVTGDATAGIRLRADRSYIPGCTRPVPAPEQAATPDRLPNDCRPTIRAGDRRIVVTMTTTLAPQPTDTSIAVAARAVDATKFYGKGEAQVRALDHVSVDFAAGRFTAIMGPSGSGKSTLMHALAGLDSLTSGSVWIGDVELGRLKEKKLTQLRRDHIGFVFQSFNLVPTLNAIENMTLPMRLAGRKPERDWVDNVVDTVGLRSRLLHRPSELSGGQQQRVAVARALVSRPQIVFADEPTGNLDSRTGAEILSFMRTAVREFGQTIVMVTHDPVAASYADRAVFLADGHIVGDLTDPTADGVFARMRTLGE
jgi:putative ABC transport system ATP-binding protein